MSNSGDRVSGRIGAILLCSDILATRESEQASNLRWFADLLERPIRAALPEAVLRKGLDAGFRRDAVLQGLVAADALQDRHCWFDPGALSPEGLDALREAIGEDTLIVGYELSEMTRAALSRAGLAYLDIWLHPVRFADDILFAMRASDPAVQSRLSAFELPHEALAAQADILKVQNYRGFAKFERNLVEGAALLIGQTARDKSVLGRDGFLGLSDFQEEVARLSRQHPRVYFSRHPNEPRLDPDARALLSRHDNIVEIEAPTYHLLADGRLDTVAGISSSVLEEARFFGKRTVRFFRPPFPLDGDARYTTILQSLCFSHFWAEILRDVAPTEPCAPAGFIDPKNKLRHALSFYWGYRDIDRYEQSAPVARNGDAAKDQAVVGDQAVEISVETSDLVSFDLFDTLLTRRFASPRDVFVSIADKASKIAGGSALDFPMRRSTAEREATARAGKAGRDDPTLAEIYCALLGAPRSDARVEQLCMLEVEAERAALRPRAAGAELFRRARQANRRIAILSDMYLPREVIEDVLASCGYEGWEALYLSCERGVTKRNGGLFELLLNDCGVPPDRILHIGDNPMGDVAVPGRLGIQSLHLPKPVEMMGAAAPYLMGATRRMADDARGGGTTMLAQIASRHFDDPRAATVSDDLGRDPEAFGYVFLGPFLAGFGQWLHREAISQGIDRLGFLTREGSVLHAAFAALHPDSPIAAETVFASRRIVNAAVLASPADITQRAEQARGARHRSVADFLNMEFGLEESEIDPDALIASGFPNAEIVIGPGTPAANLRSLAEAHTDRILARAKDTRQTLRAYLADTGVTTGRAALVDIGYAGRTQAAYARIAKTRLSGLYAATFRLAKDVLGELPASAYLAEGVAANDHSYGIVRHRRVYETLLCAPGPTYAGIAKATNGWEGVRAQGCDTPLRDAFVRSAHAGALAFVRDFAAEGGAQRPVSGSIATALLDAVLDAPSPGMAAWLGALEFEDSYDVRGIARLVDSPTGADSAVWVEGARALTAGGARRRSARGPAWTAYGPYGVLGWRHALVPFVAPVIARIGDAHDADHYRDDPIGFFRRLSDPRYRRIGRLLYPWD